MLVVLIVSISAAVAALVIGFIIYRCLFRTTKRSPLPPVQMLAHERERHEQQLRQSVYVHDLHSSSSLPGSRQNPFSPANFDSPYNHQNAGDPLSSPPRQSRLYHSRSSVSLRSSASSESPYDHRTSRVLGIPHARPKSYVSSRRSSVRGAPHHNQVEIVLPTPLAVHPNTSSPDLMPSSSPNRQSRPTSFYDQWTPPLSRSTSRSRRHSYSEEQARNSPARTRQISAIPPVPPVPLIYSASASPVSREASPRIDGRPSTHRLP